MCQICVNAGRNFHSADGSGGGGVSPLGLNANERGGSTSNGKPSLTVEGGGLTLSRDIGGWGAGVNLTFAFRSTAPTTMPDDTVGFTRFNEAQIAQTLLALQSWSDVANITFTRVNGTDGYSNNATLLLSNYASGSDGAAAFAYLPDQYRDTDFTDVSGDSWYNSSLLYNSNPFYQNYGRLVLVHEIGHSIGLSHPGNYNAGEGDPSYADADYHEDSLQYTTMSYWDETETGANHQGVYAAAPLLDDISAIQFLYGANMTTRTGDTVYGFNSNTDRDFYTASNASSKLVMAVWDAGGYDTLDMSGYAVNQVIDLRQGNFSNVGGGTANVAIAIGAVIERAIGGSGADTIYGQSFGATVERADLVKAAGTVNGSIATAVSLDGAFDREFSANVISSTNIPHATVRAVSNGGFEYYAFTAQAGANIIVDLDGTSANLDAFLYVLNSNGGQVAFNDDRGNDAGSDARTDSALQFIASSTGVYYVVVGAYGTQTTASPLSAGDRYTLNVSVSSATVQASGALVGSRLDGMAGDDTLIGHDGDDTLVGGAGADRMQGGRGNDAYYVDNVGDTVVEAANQGADTVFSTIEFSLAGLANVENLTLQGTARINATGNALDNRLVGNSAANTLDGGAGADRMEGGSGNDTYFVDNAGDVVIEAAGGGVDKVNTTVTWSAAGQDIENIVITGTGRINIVGNELNNVMVGNDDVNALNGSRGADRMVGGGGNDLYYVDNVGDVVVEVAGGGTDTVRASISYTLGANVERLQLVGSQQVNAIGNALDNVITGNARSNVIIGMGGRDLMTGGAGVDRFDFRAVSDSPFAAYDRITDLEDHDVINLSTIDANSNVDGNQAFTLVDQLTGAAGQIALVYVAAAQATILSADVNGDGVADMRIVLNGNHEDFTNFML